MVAEEEVVTRLDVSLDCFIVLGCCNGGGVRWPLFVIGAGRQMLVQ